MSNDLLPRGIAAHRESAVEGFERCPVCGGRVKCIQSDPGKHWRKRRYKCGTCNHRVTTYELAATHPLLQSTANGT